MTKLWSFDFGKATGVALGVYGPNQPYQLVEAWQVQNGILGFCEWLNENPLLLGDVFVAEKFTLNPGESNRFLPDLSGVPAEGALAYAVYPSRVIWQLRSAKSGVSDGLLKKHTLWQDGKTLNWTDGRDGNDAIIHALFFLKTLPHLPTLQHYFREDYNAT